MFIDNAYDGRCWIDEVASISNNILSSMSIDVPDNHLILNRTYYKNGTHGTVEFPDGTTFETLENPWLNNKNSISCIQEGEYVLKMRNSPVVERTSKGEFQKGWEVTDVPDRTYIMWHVGNYVRNTEGCILVGKTRDFADGYPVIWSSAIAFRSFMGKMTENETWLLSVTSEGFHA